MEILEDQLDSLESWLLEMGDLVPYENIKDTLDMKRDISSSESESKAMDMREAVDMSLRM